MTSKDITREIVSKIYKKELLPNDKLPSEMQISIKYNVSRIVATKAYNSLKQIGAIYSIPKKGFFVAEHFSGIISSINDEYNIDELKDIKEYIALEHDGYINSISEKFLSFKREHFRDRQLVIVSHNWLNEDIQKYQNEDIVRKMIWDNKLISAVNILKFEHFNAFGQDVNLVNTKIFYSQKNIAYIQKNVVSPKFFSLIKKEWAI